MYISSTRLSIRHEINITIFLKYDNNYTHSKIFSHLLQIYLFIRRIMYYVLHYCKTARVHQYNIILRILSKYTIHGVQGVSDLTNNNQLLLIGHSIIILLLIGLYDYRHPVDPLYYLSITVLYINIMLLTARLYYQNNREIISFY